MTATTMATQGCKLFTKGEEKTFTYQNNTVSNIQYNTLNLNQLHYFSSDVVVSRSKSFHIGNDKMNTCHNGNTKANTWRNQKPYENMNQNLHYKKEKLKFETKKTSNSNNSTLSLHIAAYENLVEAVDFEWIPKEQRTVKKLMSPKEKRTKERKIARSKFSLTHKISRIFHILQAYFEFPRQQENEEAKTPEVSHFQASQKLLNPNAIDDAVIKGTNVKREENEYSDEKMFNLVFNGPKMCNLHVVPLPDEIKIPRKKGVHVQCYSVVASETKINKVHHNDDMVPWFGKPRTKNYIINNEDGKIVASECRTQSIVTHGQCYYVTHGKITDSKIRKKIYSATSPSSESPSPNTLIVIVYDIEKDLDPFNISSSSPSSSGFITPKASPSFQLPMKRQANSKPEAELDKKRKDSESTKACLINFDPNKFFAPIASSSPPSTKKANLPILISKLEMQLKEAKENLHKERTKREELQQRYDDRYKMWYNLSGRFDYLTKKSEENTTEFEAQITELKSQLEEAKDNFLKVYEEKKYQKLEADERIKAMEDEMMELKLSLQKQSGEKSNVMDIKVKGKYIPEAKLTMSKLTNMGISVNNVGPAMACVAEMFGQTLNSIPSARTVAKSPFLSLHFVQEQLRRVVTAANEEEIATTLGSDETKKAGLVWQNYMLSVNDELNRARTYCLGNVPVIDKSSETSINAMENIVQALNTDDGINYWETFIMGLGNRMSDEAATEKLFTKRVEALRKVIIDGQERYDHLNESQKENLAKLRSFFCQLHVLQNLTPVVLNILLEDEKKRRRMNNIPKAAVLMLLELCSTHLGNRASSKYTSNTPWKDYCRIHNILFGTIPDFIGNRFNILFAIAACVFYLRLHIIDFIEKFDTDLRKTHVLEWLKDPVVISHLHILAAFNVYVTAPLLRLTEHSPSIDTLADHAKSLIEYLEEVNEDPLTLFTGHPPFEDVEEAEEITKRSKAHIKHLDEATVSHPKIMVDVIEDLAEATIIYFKKKYKDFLPGGEHYLSAADIGTVPRHNKSCEHNFGILTWDYSHAPHKRTAVRAIKVQATINKTFEWYDALSEEEKEKLLKEALINAPKLENDAAAQQKAYETARWNRVLEKQTQDKIAKAIMVRRQGEANKVVQKYGGCWTSKDEMKAFLLNEHRESEKRKAVEAQLKFHKLSPLTEKSDTKLCVLSMLNEQKKRVPKPLTVLMANLKAIIVKKSVIDDEDLLDDEY